MESDVTGKKIDILLAAGLLASVAASPAALAQSRIELNDAGYFETRGVNVLVFSNWYDGLFADSKISGVEIIQQGERTATNGDVRLSATPGQWDPIGRMVKRTVDAKTGTIEALLEYPEHKFQYRIRAERKPDGVHIAVILDQPLPAALVGKAGFNLEFLPSAYFRESYLADGKGGSFPLYPAGDMVAGGERNAASGRDIGPGAEPLPMASGQTIVFAPEDPARRVTVRSAAGKLELFDGRNQAQNGWFVLRSLIPEGKTGRVVEWTVSPNSVPGWLRDPVIGHSQLGYAPQQAKVAVIELDANAKPAGVARLLRLDATGKTVVAHSATPKPAGKYLRYNYLNYDFSQVREPGLYQLDYAGKRTATFRIAPDIYDTAWHPSLDVYMPVQMDHMLVNEAYRVWHGDSHRDDARQAPVNHEHVDLYRQGPTTDTKYKPGEHVPGLDVGGWLDAGDFDIRTQTQYAVVRTLARIWDDHQPMRDQTLVDHNLRHVEMHVPDGKPDLLQQIEHGALYLASMYDAVGYAVHGVVEPNVAQYTHLGDAATKTDGLIYDPKLAYGERKGERSGTPDDRWVFTSKSSALNYGSAAGLAAAARALRSSNPALSEKALGIAKRVWDEEHSHAPHTFSHGNTTGGKLEHEEFGAAIELLLTTRDAKYAERIEALWPAVSGAFGYLAPSLLPALPLTSPAFTARVREAARAWKAAPAPANPYGVPITEGGWAGNGAVMQYGLTDHAIAKAFPELSDGSRVFRALDYLHGTHPGSNLSFVSGVGTQSKEVAYGSNRADFSFIAGGVVPGVLILKPDFPENSENWPFFWGENEYVVNMSPTYIELVHAARELLAKQ
ncbi:glycoside hydrolase family 9 protein [Sphingomonas sp. M1-B02]|uniref:glycoside hydrolase family 9 protein n=1 Tax=Sphingomonas sp. M1-B02 TaxID=3114300 RepID=UPI00223EFF12|nr:glycoside hydrolase family 9 protein [Sphingomonas sp. S6-11]UZK65719.1 glycoside hydrolase family 9 protein [Sphingomonas sp. S6-11]